MKAQHVTQLAALVLMGACLTACNDPVAGANAAIPVPAAAAPVAAALPAPIPACNSCGIVRSVTAIQQDGAGTGAGAVIGGIVGGVAGNQVGGGSGRKIATAAGVIGGAVLGNEVEQNRNGTTTYDVVVDMEGGGQQVVNLADASGISPGTEVSVLSGRISLR